MGPKRTLRYGASPKGNVIPQLCGLGEQDLPCISADHVQCLSI